MARDPQLEAYFGGGGGSRDPQLEAYFNGPPKAAQPRDPQLEEYFRNEEVRAQRVAPPPVVIRQPAPQATAPLQPAQGPPPAPEPSLGGQALGAAQKALPWAIKALTVPFDAGNYALNKGAEAGLAAEREGGFWAGVVGSIRGTLESIPEAVVKGTFGPSVQPRWLSEPIRAEMRHRNIDLPDVDVGLPFTDQRLKIEGNDLLAEGAQFLASWHTDPKLAKMGASLLGFVARTPPMKAAAAKALSIPLPTPRGVKTGAQMIDNRQKGQAVKRAFTGGAATAALLEREGAQALKKVEAIWQTRYTDKGIDLARQNPLGGRSNVADELTTDWLEAGWKGARYSDRSAVEAAAAQHGIKASDLREAAGLIRGVYRKSGNWLERVGYLKPGTVARFGDQYAAAVYRFASKNPDDVAAALDAATKNGWITDEALNLAHKVLDPKRGANYQPGKSRMVEDPALAAKLGREYQAGVAMGAALPKQAAVGGKFQALDEISQNPELFTPGTAPRPGPEWELRTIGNHEGYWHPAALAVIDAQGAKSLLNSPGIREFDALVAPVARSVRRIWATMNPVVQANNVKSNVALTQGAMASRGLKWNPKMFAEDAAAFLKAKKNPGSDVYYESLARRSRAFSGDAGQLHDVGRSLRKNVGIDRTRDKALKGAQKLGWDASAEAFGGVEEAFKYSLFKRLVQGKVPEDEAAALVDRALFDHSDTNTLVYLLNRWGFVPFATTRLKALENALAIWRQNPEILLRHSGVRAAESLSGMAGGDAERRGLADDKGNLRFYVPGVRDEQGAPYALGGQVLSQNPLSFGAYGPLDPGMWDPLQGGTWAPARNAIKNEDPFKLEATGEIQIVPEGSMPPPDAFWERVRYARDAYMPAIWPGGRGLNQIDRAWNGVSQYPGLNQEPVPVAQAVIKALLGVRVVRTETPGEKEKRRFRNEMERLPNQMFQAQYEGEVLSGRARRTQFPEHYFPKSRQEAYTQFLKAKKNLQQYLLGAQDVQGSPEAQAKIRRLTDWLVALEEHVNSALGEEFKLEELVALEMQSAGA